jgi:hypothetical protein
MGFLGLSLLLLCVGCDGSSKCTPGKTSHCACPEGKMGIQICQDDSTFGSCQCGEGQDGGVENLDQSIVDSDQGASAPGSPKFLSFGTDSTKFTEGQSITFTAVLTDPDGIEDLIGGSLKSEDGLHNFGAFATAAQEGAYSFELTWSKLNNALDLTFEGEQSYTFIAEFFDAAGNTASRSATILAYCDLGAACTGTCVDLMEDTNHCGTCDNACAKQCWEGRCEHWTPCHPTPTNCQTVCTAEGCVCDDNHLQLRAYFESGCSGYSKNSNNFQTPPTCSTNYSPTVELPIENQSGWYPVSIECLCLKDPP